MSPATPRDRKQTLCRWVGSHFHRWKATLAVLVGCGVLLWHVLACVESPMAFSPDGDLAFTTVGPAVAPGDEQPDDSAEDQPYVSRLFVLPKGEKTLRLIEETQDHLLCAPAYSPDGKRLVYLRAPKKSEPSEEEPEAQHDHSEDGPLGALVSVDGYEFDDFSLPSILGWSELLKEVEGLPRSEVTLVARDAASGEVRSTTKLYLPFPEDEGEGPIFTFALGSTKYSPDGQWIYVCAGRFLLAVHPARKQARLLAAGVWSTALSPDGSAVATLSDEAIGLVDTDGSRAVFLRTAPGAPPTSAKGMAWLDNDTLAVLTAKEDGAPLSLALIRRDGTVSRSIELEINEEDNYWEELAVSPDRKRIAIATETILYLLDADGSIVSQWKEEGIRTCSPTFSPDSKQLACKLVPEEDESYTQTIVFFSSEGKELFRIDVPQSPE